MPWKYFIALELCICVQTNTTMTLIIQGINLNIIPWAHNYKFGRLTMNNCNCSFSLVISEVGIAWNQTFRATFYLITLSSPIIKSRVDLHQFFSSIYPFFECWASFCSYCAWSNLVCVNITSPLLLPGNEKFLLHSVWD